MTQYTNSIGQYGTPEYNQLLANLRAAIKRLEIAEAEEALYLYSLPGHVVLTQSHALVDIKICAAALVDYYARLGNADDIPF